ncbi:uncharacterized protein LOC143305952 [Osmia lignaria lignaria]|uniref:uncharacterized protein LOC143305952 n=1 Tax=Osmia lignaria lignaria TaxID=1437193 RepID=UPI00402B06D2
MGKIRKNIEISDRALFNEISRGFWNREGQNRTIEIYTDGSKKNDGLAVGAGVAIRLGDGSWEEASWSLHRASSVFSAEAFAIFQAMRYANNRPRTERFLIITDSASVLEKIAHVGSDLGDNPWIHDILRELKASRSENGSAGPAGLDVAFAWVPSHVGIEGNEKADILAGSATFSEEDISPEVSERDIRRFMLEGAWERFSNKMCRIGLFKGVKYFNNRNNNVGNRRPWFYKISGFDRKFLTRMNRLRLNHFNFGESLFRKNLVESKECVCGNQEESLEHVIWECDRFMLDRLNLVTFLEEKGFMQGSEILELLMCGNLGVCKRVLKFLDKLGKII